MIEITKYICITIAYTLIIYLVLVLFVFVFQRNLIYYPNGSKPSNQLLAEDNLRFWPSSEDSRGLASAEELANATGTVVIFHGNFGTAYQRVFYIKALSQYGLRVILAEYPGYGGRDGKPKESALASDAMETLRLAYHSYGAPLYLWGESLGSGVISGVAAQTDIPVAGLVLFLPWDSLPDLAQTHYRYLPARWLALDRYNSVKNLEHYEGKVAVLLAERDEVVPIQHGKRLFESITTAKKLWVFKDARHNEAPIAAGLPWWKEVIVFISQ